MGAPPRPAPPRGGAARVRGRGRSFTRAVGCSGARSGWFDTTCSYTSTSTARSCESEASVEADAAASSRVSHALCARSSSSAHATSSRSLAIAARTLADAVSRRSASARAEASNAGEEGPPPPGGDGGGEARDPRRRRSGAAPASADAAPREEEGAGRIMIACAARRAREPRSARRGREPRRSLLSETRERPTSLSSSFQSLFIFSGFYFSNIASSTSR